MQRALISWTLYGGQRYDIQLRALKQRAQVDMQGTPVVFWIPSIVTH